MEFLKASRKFCFPLTSRVTTFSLNQVKNLKYLSFNLFLPGTKHFAYWQFFPLSAFSVSSFSALFFALSVHFNTFSLTAFNLNLNPGSNVISNNQSVRAWCEIICQTFSFWLFLNITKKRFFIKIENCNVLLIQKQLYR